MTVHYNQKTMPAGRVAVRWFVFLVLFHLLPVPWFIAVAGGLAPASFLFAVGGYGLFTTDFGSLSLSLMLLIPALVSGIIFVVSACLIAAGLGRLRKPPAQSLSLIIILAVCVGVALNPIYVSGSHGGGHQFSLLDFVDILGQFRVPSAVSLGYFVCLAVLLAGLLVYQHTPQSFPALPLSRESRRRILRRSLAGGLIVTIVFFCWVHRALFFLKPLAEMGVAGAQYRLALALQENPGSEARSDKSFRYWLERAAEQGHIDAVMALARSPRSAEERLRWLTIAAGGGLAEAQYQLYRFMLKSDVVDYKSRSALEWLQSASEGGFADAQYELGRILIQGDQQKGIKKNSQKARQWWERAAAKGHGRAMEELAWRYNQAADGFPRDPQQAATLFEKIADGYRQGLYGLPKNQHKASSSRKRADEINALEERVARGDPEALVTVGRRLLRTRTERAQGVALLEKAAGRGDAQIHHELGSIFLFGRHGIAQDLKKGRKWWDLALAQNHVKTMEYVAAAYQTGRFGYQKLLKAYESGQYLGEVDDQFIAFQRRRLEYMGKALQYQEDRSRRYEQANALERQIMEIEDLC